LITLILPNERDEVFTAFDPLALYTGVADETAKYLERTSL